MGKKISIFIVAIMLVLCLAGCQTNLKVSVTYEENQEGFALKTFKGTSKDVVLEIPDFYQEKPVTELAEFSVSQNKYLVELKIGKNITKISDRSIMSNEELTTITVDEENTSFKSVDGVLFTYDMKTLVAFPTNKIPTGGVYTIPDGVEILSENSFYQADNEKFTEVKMPDSVKRIEDRSFMSCRFAKINISKNCEYLGIDSLSLNTNLSKIFIPSSVTEIGDYALNGCSALKEILMARPSLDGMKCGKNWITIADKTLWKKIPLIFNSVEA